MTYSIVAWDSGADEVGVAVQSCAFGTGAACAWALPGVGAVATQSFTERRYGPDGLSLMRDGLEPGAALERLLAEDDLREVRQVAYVDREGRTAAHSGAGCIPHAGDLQGPGFSAQGNMLRSRRGLAGDGRGVHRNPRNTRRAPARGARRGGDGGRRLSRTPGGGPGRRHHRAGPGSPYERVFDLRVDDHREPLDELRRLHRMAAGYRRRNRIAEGADPAGEVAAAREAGLPEHEVRTAEMFAYARHGDLERVRSLMAEAMAAEPLWRAAFERYEKLGLIPEGVMPDDRSSRIDAWRPRCSPLHRRTPRPTR